MIKQIIIFLRIKSILRSGLFSDKFVRISLINLTFSSISKKRRNFTFRYYRSYQKIIKIIPRTDVIASTVDKFQVVKFGRFDVTFVLSSTFASFVDRVVAVDVVDVVVAFVVVDVEFVAFIVVVVVGRDLPEVCGLFFSNQNIY